MEFSSPWKQICWKSISSLWFSGFWKETIWQWFSQWPFTVGEANAVSESREKKMILFSQDKLKTHMMRNHGYSNDDIKNTFKQTTPGRQRSSIVVNRWNVNVEQVGAIWKKGEWSRGNNKKWKLYFFIFRKRSRIVVHRDNRKSTESSSNSSDDPEANPLNIKPGRKHLNTQNKRRKP